jgi:hypothetical protein
MPINLEINRLDKFRCKWYVFSWTKWYQGDRRDRVPSLDCIKGRLITGAPKIMLIVEKLLIGFTDEFSSWPSAFFWCCVILSLQQNGGTYKKTGNVVAFLNVAPVPLHCKNHNELCIWDNIWESYVEIWGWLMIQFFRWLRKKELSDVGQKWVMVKLESAENMCHTHIKISTYCSTYQCTPYFN